MASHRSDTEAGAAARPGGAFPVTEDGIRMPALDSLSRAAAATERRALADPQLAGLEAEVRTALAALTQAVARPEATLPRPTPLVRRLIAWLRLDLLTAVDGERVAPAQIITTLLRIEQIAEQLDRAGPDEAPPFPTGLEFVAGVAHDLRSPLTSILFLAETLHAERSGEINDVQRRQLGIIYSAALGLVSVASDIIELSRGGDGLTERRPILFSVTEILESVHDIVRPMAEEKGLQVHLFPPAVDQRWGYPLALSRVLLNLTTNGLKFTDAGFVEISCRATSDTRVEFSVRDTGKGYSPDAMGTLYQPFRRSRDGKKYGFSGTGLGLAISRKLVTAMGSMLDVETRPKWGTRFFFELDLPADFPDPQPQP